MLAVKEHTACNDALTAEWYERLREEVDYRCSFCDAVQTDIGEMETKVRQAYASTAQSLREVHEVREIVKRWYGMFAFATQVLEHARFLQRTNQICGVDLSVFLEYQKESYDRLILHCPEILDACQTQKA